MQRPDKVMSTIRAVYHLNQMQSFNFKVGAQEKHLHLFFICSGNTFQPPTLSQALTGQSAQIRIFPLCNSLGLLTIYTSERHTRPDYEELISKGGIIVQRADPCSSLVS